MESRGRPRLFLARQVGPKERTQALKSPRGFNPRNHMPSSKSRRVFSSQPAHLSSSGPRRSRTFCGRKYYSYPDFSSQPNLPLSISHHTPFLPFTWRSAILPPQRQTLHRAFRERGGIHAKADPGSDLRRAVADERRLGSTACSERRERVDGASQLRRPQHACKPEVLDWHGRNARHDGHARGFTIP